MPFDHNDRYHRMLLRHVPQTARRGLDVGCGTGRFARALARRGLDVTAIDSSAETVQHARSVPGPTVHYCQGDITTEPLPPRHYDVISVLASLHHVPFETVTTLREALAPGGVLLVLGCYREQWPGDAAAVLAAVVVNTAARSANAIRDHVRAPRPAAVIAPTMPPQMTLAQVRAQARVLLPGSTVHRLLLWRYLLRFEVSSCD